MLSPANPQLCLVCAFTLFNLNDKGKIKLQKRETQHSRSSLTFTVDVCVSFYLPASDFAEAAGILLYIVSCMAAHRLCCIKNVLLHTLRLGK